VPQIVAGDFNADPDQIDTTSGMLPNFVEHMVGRRLGPRVHVVLARSPTMKIDYWFTDASGRAQPNSTQVYYGRAPVSDHYPVQTTFVVR
jgi:endonuclease/exonuclease/phosphatase family metal-dependent hydrolase